MRIQQSFHRHRASSGREGRTARIFPSPKVGICVNKRDIFIVSGQRHVCRFSEPLRLCLTPIFVQDKCNGLFPSRQQTLEENPSRTSAFAQDKLVTPLGMHSLGGDCQIPGCCSYELVQTCGNLFLLIALLSGPKVTETSLEFFSLEISVREECSRLSTDFLIYNLPHTH